MKYFILVMVLGGVVLGGLMIWVSQGEPVKHNPQVYYGRATYYCKGKYKCGKPFTGKGFVIASHNYLMPRGSKWKITNYDSGISTITTVIDSVSDSKVLVDCSLELATFLGFSKLIEVSETKAKEYKAKCKLVIQTNSKWYVESKNGSAYVGVEKI